MVPLKFFFITVLALSAAHAAPSVVDVVKDMYGSCLQHLSISCIKPKALNWLDEVTNSEAIKLTEELVIVKKPTYEIESERGLSNDIYEKFEDFLQSHDLILKAPDAIKSRSFQPEDVKVPLAVTGRSSKLIKKVILPFLLGLKFKTAVVIPITLALIALKTWKALTLGLLSLVMTGALFIFKLTKPKVSYEVVHYPQYVDHHIEHPPTPVVASGWDHPGYGRNIDGNDLAYRGHL